MNTFAPMAPAPVDTVLNYIQYDGTRPTVVVPTSPSEIHKTSVIQLPTRVRVRDGRFETYRPTLDRNGFELIPHRSAVTDFSDPVRVRKLYYPETESLLMQATGAEKVVVFDHACRLDASDQERAGTPAPVRQVHCDQTFVSGPRRVRDHLPADEAEWRLKQRCALINVWRPIGGPVLTAPLALCDARSIAPEDIVPTDFVYPDKVGEVALFRANEKHRWFYFPQMTPDEVVLIKIYDSLTDGTARLSAHTAFDDPNTPAHAPPRRSIELRALVFWAAA